MLWWYFRGTADELIEQANKAYEGRSYETAEKFYADFVGRFTSDDRLSFAKVRRALAQLRRVAETNTDPKEALKVPKSSSLQLQKSQVFNPNEEISRILLTIAEKYNAKAMQKK